MGFYDRPYLRDDYTAPGSGGRGPGGGVFVGMPRAGRVVKRLLLINFVVFILQALSQGTKGGQVGPVDQALAITVDTWWQIWRYVTFQFLHGGIWHLGLNMLGLYMLGTPLEQQWGPRRFLLFYLSCGVVAGVAYVVMGMLLGPSYLPPGMPLVGASGGVYAIVLACAVLFPQFRLIMVLFPVPIRAAAALIFGIMIFGLLQSLANDQITGQFWSDVAHLGGAVAGAVWIWVLPQLGVRLASARVKSSQGAWQRKVHREVEEEKTIDEILRKIHDQGINSLTKQEKKKLADATERRRNEGP